MKKSILFVITVFLLGLKPAYNQPTYYLLVEVPPQTIILTY